MGMNLKIDKGGEMEKRRELKAQRQEEGLGRKEMSKMGSGICPGYMLKVLFFNFGMIINI